MLAATYALRAGMTVDDVAGTWAPYLTLTEAVRMAAGVFRTDKPASRTTSSQYGSLDGRGASCRVPVDAVPAVPVTRGTSPDREERP